MTLKEATENGVDYWEFFVLIEGKQILAAGKREEYVYHFADSDMMHIGKLSAPAGLVAVAEGDGWYRFEFGDGGHLMIWPSVKGPECCN